ncbi:hypothetical protein GW17_00047465 [Ensete ventricosum]|nr:hypothetical protein GW17_00047465 [Ensete ventricosum]
MPCRDAVSWNTLIAAYDQWGPCEEAIEVFTHMMRSCCKVDRFGVSSVISACANLRFFQNGSALHGLSVKIGLDSHVQVDWVSFVSVLDACEGLLDLEEGSKIHAKIVKSGFGADRIVGSALVALYAKCGCLTHARSVTHSLAAVDDFSWSVLIAEYVKHGCLDCASELFDSMAIKTVPLWNALIGDRAEPDVVTENIELLASVYFSHFGRTKFQHGAD